MSKKETAPVADLVAVAEPPAEAAETSAAVIDLEGEIGVDLAESEEMELDPVGKQPERGELEVDTETAKVLYDQLVLTPEMRDLGAAANIDERTLLARAREFHSCYPDSWRELFLADLAKWAQGEMPTEERLRRGIIHSPERELFILDEKLQDRLNTWRPETRIKVFQGLIDELDGKIAELKAAGGKGTRYG